MEPLIQHVRFFNGQFLRQQEFREEQGYLNHMRRRLHYAMLTDGVIEVTSADLTIVPINSRLPAQLIRQRLTSASNNGQQPAALTSGAAVEIRSRSNVRR